MNVDVLTVNTNSKLLYCCDEIQVCTGLFLLKHMNTMPIWAVNLHVTLDNNFNLLFQ